MKGRQLRRPEFIARQAAHPSGLLSRLIFRLMAEETVAVNERTLELLAPNRDSRVLENWFWDAHDSPDRFPEGHNFGDADCFSKARSDFKRFSRAPMSL